MEKYVSDGRGKLMDAYVNATRDAALETLDGAIQHRTETGSDRM